MTRKIKLIILISIIASVIALLKWRISAFDLRFYYGKDGGIFRRLESILLLGSIFFMVMPNSRRIIFFIVGFFLSLFSSILLYIALGFLNLFESDLPFHILACLIFIILFFSTEEMIAKTTTTANTG